MSTAGRSGKLTKSVTVETNDPANPKTTLSLSCLVVTELDLEQRSVRFIPAKRGVESKQSVRILAKDPDSLTLGPITHAIAGLNALIENETDNTGKKVYKVTLAYTPPEIGSMNGKVKIKTSNEKVPELELDVMAEVEGPIRATARRLTVWGKKEGEGRAGLSILSDTVSFKVVKVTDDKKALTLTIKEVQPGKEYRLDAEATPETMKAGKGFAGEILVTTNQKDQPQMVIPYTYNPNAQPSGMKVDPNTLKPNAKPSPAAPPPAAPH